jgi:hypothetical protein
MSEPVTRRRFVTKSALAGAVLTVPAMDLGLMTGAAEAEGAASQVSSPAPGHEPGPAQGAGSAAAAERPEQVIRRLMTGFQMTQLVYVAAKLKIADHLAGGPQTVAQLAAATESHADSLYRVLRALAGFGVFAEEEGPRFRLTPAGALLRSGTPGSQRGAAEARGEDWTWRAWGALLQSVKTGQTGFDIVYGKNTFDWFAEHPDAARIFDTLQADVTARSASVVAAGYDFASARVIVDVGGGNGTLLAAILQRHAAPRGILFDLPHVVEAAKPVLDPAIGRRCQFVGGDFFKAVPDGGDTYVMKYILHDWEESRARAILANCRTAMAKTAGAKLLVVEDLVCGPNVPCEAKLGDVNMLARTGGKNRTEREYRDLLRAGGFEVQRILPISGDLALIEAVPV